LLEKPMNIFANTLSNMCTRLDRLEMVKVASLRITLHASFDILQTVGKISVTYMLRL
jgi:hypothetical protein